MVMNIGNDMVGACPICRLQYNGRVHNCPGELPTEEHNAIGAQFPDEIPNERPTSFDDRLADGFEMLGDSGWDSNY